jgi:hypothetical protein
LDLSLKMAGNDAAAAGDRDYLSRELANGRAMLNALKPEFSRFIERCTIGQATGGSWHEAILRFGQQTLASPGQAGTRTTLRELLPLLESEHGEVLAAIAAEAAAVERVRSGTQAAGAGRDQGKTPPLEEDKSNTGRDQDKKRARPPSPLQFDILDALRELKAIDPDKRRTGADVAGKVGGGVTEQSVKAPLADLKHRRLVDSRTGRNGGTWLTSTGLNCINSLRPKR